MANITDFMKSPTLISWLIILAAAGLACWLWIPRPPELQARIKNDGLRTAVALIGLIVIGLAVKGVFTGTAQIAYHHGMQKYSRKKEPIGFWLVTAFEIFGGTLFVLIALKSF